MNATDSETEETRAILTESMNCRCLADAINVHVYDFINLSPKSNAPQTRMDARAVFTTLLTCLRL